MEFLPDIPLCKSCCCFIPLKLGIIFIAVLDIIVGASVVISFSLYYIQEEVAEKVNKAAKEIFGQLSTESNYIDICLSSSLFVIGILLLMATLRESKNLINIYVFAKSLLCVATLMGTFFNFSNVPLKGFVFFAAFIINIYTLLCVISYMHELPEVLQLTRRKPRRRHRQRQENIELKVVHE